MAVKDQICLWTPQALRILFRLMWHFLGWYPDLIRDEFGNYHDKHDLLYGSGNMENCFLCLF